MIVVIGGVKVKVDLKMALPDAPKEKTGTADNPNDG